MRTVGIVAGAVFVALGAVMTAAVLARGGGLSVLHLVVTPLVGWSFGVAGLLACLRRRWRRTGVLLLGVGLAWFVHLAAWTHVAPLIAATAPLSNAYAAVFAHLLLAFPDGRLASRGVRVLVAAAYLDAVGVQWLATLAAGAGPPGSWVRGDHSIAAALYDLEGALGVLLACLVILVLARRAATADRRPPAAMWAAAVIALVAMVASVVSSWYAPGHALASWVVFSLALAAVPFAFLASLLGVRLRRAGAAGLIVRLGRVGDVAGLRVALADALHDPSLELAFWVPDRSGYVDAHGRPTALPGAGRPTVATLVERDGRRIGALVHDAALRGDPELVEAVAAAAGLALENARLQAELRVRLAELEASRSRLVEAAAAERRRLERNLHDGAQQRLVSVAFTLGLARSRLAADPAAAGSAMAEAQTGLTQALDELRRLSQGIHPGVLVERGLRAAIAELALTASVPVHVEWTAPDRLPEPVESAGYYVVAELLANAAKHAGPADVRIRVTAQGGTVTMTVSDDGAGGADAGRGTGLRGLADRVAALDGRMTVHSPAGEGTTVQVEVRCG
jgi:signal transduction histidine kinase